MPGADPVAVGTRRYPVTWTGQPKDLRQLRWTVLAAKIHDTPGRCWLAVLGAGHRLIAAQNGVDHCEHLAR